MSRRKTLRLDAFKDRLETELLSVGFPVPILNILLPLVGPLILSLLEKCVNKHNPQKLRAKAEMLHRGGWGIVRTKMRLAERIEELPISMTPLQREQFMAALVKVGAETDAEDYHAAAVEMDFTPRGTT